MPAPAGAAGPARGSSGGCEIPARRLPRRRRAPSPGRRRCAPRGRRAGRVPWWSARCARAHPRRAAGAAPTRRRRGRCRTRALQRRRPACAAPSAVHPARRCTRRSSGRWRSSAGPGCRGTPCRRGRPRSGAARRRAVFASLWGRPGRRDPGVDRGRSGLRRGRAWRVPCLCRGSLRATTQVLDSQGVRGRAVSGVDRPDAPPVNVVYSARPWRSTS